MRRVGDMSSAASHLQGVDGDGAAPPAVQVTNCVHCCCAAEQHQPAEQVLLGHREQDLDHTGLCRQKGRQTGTETDRQTDRQANRETVSSLK